MNGYPKGWSGIIWPSAITGGGDAWQDMCFGRNFEP